MTYGLLRADNARTAKLSEPAVPAFRKISISLPEDLATYAQAEGERLSRKLSWVVADALTRRRADLESIAAPSRSSSSLAVATDLTALVRQSLADGAEREARIEIRIAELADILMEVLGQQTADKQGPRRPLRAD